MAIPPEWDANPSQVYRWASVRIAGTYLYYTWEEVRSVVRVSVLSTFTVSKKVDFALLPWAIV